MNDHESKTPSTKSSDGVGGDASKAVIIKQGGKPKDEAALATCRFVNRRNGRTCVTIYWNGGGVSNGTLYNQNDVWDIHGNGDCYCWQWDSPGTPDCSLRCYPGNTYYVG